MPARRSTLSTALAAVVAVAGLVGWSGSAAAAPVPVPPAGSAQISSSESHSCSVSEKGKVLCWGLAASGQAGPLGLLGGGTLPKSLKAVEVPGLPAVDQVAVGDGFSCARARGDLTVSNSVWCWGINRRGELGRGSVSKVSPYWDAIPARVAGLSGVRQIAADRNTACALTSAGTVSCWGILCPFYDVSAAITDADWCFDAKGAFRSFPSPKVIPGVSGATQISVGWATSCAVVGGGGVVCWGSNSFGQLGYDPRRTTVGGYPRNFSSNAVRIAGVSNATQVVVGLYNVCALLTNWTVKCWGSYNYKGEWGDGSDLYESPPNPLNPPPRLLPTMVAGVRSAIALAGDTSRYCVVMSHDEVDDEVTPHSVRCWGAPTFSSETPSTVPTVVSGFDAVTQLSVGGTNVCARRWNAPVKCLGANSMGQLGNGTTSDSSWPVEVQRITSTTGTPSYLDDLMWSARPDATSGSTSEGYPQYAGPVATTSSTGSTTRKGTGATPVPGVSVLPGPTACSRSARRGAHAAADTCPPDSYSLPTTVLPEVHNQGSFGSCTAFASVEAFESMAKTAGLAPSHFVAPWIFAKRFPDELLREQTGSARLQRKIDGDASLITTVSNMLDGLARYGVPAATTVRQTLLDVTKDIDIHLNPFAISGEAEDDVFDEGWAITGHSHHYSNPMINLPTTNGGSAWFPAPISNSVAENVKLKIKTAVADRRPAIISMLVWSGFENVPGGSETNAYSRTSASGALRYGDAGRGHAMIVVGYSPKGVRVQNSWGTGFGTDGRAWISWGTLLKNLYAVDTIDGVRHEHRSHNEG